jgi:protein subunit release factor B
MPESTELEKIEIRCRFSGQLAIELRQLQALGNFTTLKETVEHVVGIYAPAMVDGIIQAREVVKNSQVYSIKAVRKKSAASRQIFRETTEAKITERNAQINRIRCRGCGAILEDFLQGDRTQYCPHCGGALPNALPT